MGPETPTKSIVAEKWRVNYLYIGTEVGELSNYESNLHDPVPLNSIGHNSDLNSFALLASEAWLFTWFKNGESMGLLETILAHKNHLWQFRGFIQFPSICVNYFSSAGYSLTPIFAVRIYT